MGKWLLTKEKRREPKVKCGMTQRELKRSMFGNQVEKSLDRVFGESWMTVDSGRMGGYVLKRRPAKW